MSWRPTAEPEDLSTPDVSLAVEPKVSAVIEPRTRDLGGPLGRARAAFGAAARGRTLSVLRSLRAESFAKGQGMDVRPHPHIHLATVTYLFEGEIVHRDSLGRTRRCPVDINWMTAGRGIVHSERTAARRCAPLCRLHGIQLWVGLPSETKTWSPTFTTIGRRPLPAIERDGARRDPGARRQRVRRAVAVHTFSPLLYADVQMGDGARSWRCPTIANSGRCTSPQGALLCPRACRLQRRGCWCSSPVCPAAGYCPR